MPVRVKNLSHIGFTVRDLDRSVAFYTEALGMRLTERFEYPAEEVGHGVTVASGAFIRCDSTHHRISIFQFKDGVLPDDGAQDLTAPMLGLHHIAFEIATSAELLEKFRELRDRGVSIVNCRKGGPGNQPRFYARDPDGYLLEFFWSIDEVGWDGLPREYEPIQEIDLEAFDFDGFLAQREEAAARMRAAVAGDAGAAGRA